MIGMMLLATAHFEEPGAAAHAANQRFLAEWLEQVMAGARDVERALSAKAVIRSFVDGQRDTNFAEFRQQVRGCTVTEIDGSLDFRSETHSQFQVSWKCGSKTRYITFSVGTGKIDGIYWSNSVVLLAPPPVS